MVWLYRLCWTEIDFKCVFTIFTTIILHNNIFHIKDTQDVYNASLCLAAGIPPQVKYQHIKPSVSKMKNILTISQRLLLIYGLLISSFSTLWIETSKAGLQFFTDTFWTNRLIPVSLVNPIWVRVGRLVGPGPQTF